VSHLVIQRSALIGRIVAALAVLGLLACALTYLALTIGAPSVPPALGRSGAVTGIEMLAALRDVPVTGPVRLTGTSGSSAGRSSTVEAREGHFRISLSEGTYLVSGSAGAAPCPPVTVKVTADRTSAVWITCQGL